MGWNGMDLKLIKSLAKVTHFTHALRFVTCSSHVAQ